MPAIASADSRRRRALWVAIPPPLLFAAAFGIGLLADRVVASARLAAMIERTRFFGLAALGMGFLLAGSAAVLFIVHRTTIVPHGSARSLVTSGPYRLTRNPMYLGLTLIYIGAALLTRSYGALAMLALPLWVLQRRVIPYEERALAETFGETFREYASATRRWI